MCLSGVCCSVAVLCVVSCAPLAACQAKSKKLSFPRCARYFQTITPRSCSVDLHLGLGAARRASASVLGCGRSSPQSYCTTSSAVGKPAVSTLWTVSPPCARVPRGSRRFNRWPAPRKSAGCGSRSQRHAFAPSSWRWQRTPSLSSGPSACYLPTGSITGCTCSGCGGKPSALVSCWTRLTSLRTSSPPA